MLTEEYERHRELCEMLGEIRDALQLIAESLQKVTAPLGGLADLVAAVGRLEVKR